MNDMETQDQQAAREADAAGGVMFSLIGAAHALEGRLEEGFATVGLSAAKYSVLALLADAGEPLALSDLAARTSCVRSNMTHLVDRLEADGLVRRVDDPADRRVVRAALTPLGEERQAEGAKQMAKVQKGFAASLTEVDRIALGDLVARLK
jgi:DNA-binding MarR family transcriptional regulator